MNLSVNVMMLAAGLGTRLKPLTLHYPKPSIPFLNVPMGLYQFQYLKHIEISKLAVNTFHFPEKIQRLYQNQPYYKDEVFFSNETEKILGGAGGLKKAEGLLSPGKPILMMNADEVFFTEDDQFLQTAFEQHTKNKNLATVIVIQHPEAGRKFGAVWADGNQVKDISKSAQHPGWKPWHSIGLIILDWGVLDLIPLGQEANIFYDTLLPQISDGKVEIFPLQAKWYETGNPVDYFEATRIVLEDIDQKTLDFINQYDESEWIQSEEGCSLISTSCQEDPEKFRGVCVVSKSYQKEVPEAVQDSVLFDDVIINESFFKKSVS